MPVWIHITHTVVTHDTFFERTVVGVGVQDKVQYQAQAVLAAEYHVLEYCTKLYRSKNVFYYATLNTHQS